MKTILFIGGGRETTYAVRHAQSMGLRTVVADHFIDCACASIADDFLICPIHQPKTSAAIVRDGLPKLDGVICAASDFPATAATVAQALGLNGISPLTGWTASSKQEMKIRFLEAGLRVPKFHDIRSGEHLKALAREAPYPLVIKPKDSRGSRGVLTINKEEVVNNSENVVNKYEESKSHSRDKSVIAEEWLSGPQVSTEGLVIGGICYTISISDRNYSRLDEFAPYVIEDGGETPTGLPETLQDEMREVMQECATVMGIENGPIKGDFVIHKGKVYIIEIAARLSGGYLSTHQIPYCYGVDLIGCAIRQAIGERVFPEEVTPKRYNHIAIRFMFPREGTISSVTDVGPLEGFAGVELCEVFVKEGDKVGPYKCHPDRAGVLITSGIDRQAAIKANEKFMKCVSFSMEVKDEQKAMGKGTSSITASTIRYEGIVGAKSEGTG